VIGRLFFSGSRPGEVDTQRIVNYEFVEKRTEHVLEVPIRGCVENGSFEPSETSTNIMQTDASNIISDDGSSA
jgi:hypothetical protein